MAIATICISNGIWILHTSTYLGELWCQICYNRPAWSSSTSFFMTLPSVLWLCWLGVRKSISPVKIEWWGGGVVICGPADAIVIPKPHNLWPHSKSRLVLPFWYWLTQVVLEKKPLNRCSSSSSSSSSFSPRIFSTYTQMQFRLSARMPDGRISAESAK